MPNRSLTGNRKGPGCEFAGVLHGSVHKTQRNSCRSYCRSLIQSKGSGNYSEEWSGLRCSCAVLQQVGRSLSSPLPFFPCSLVNESTNFNTSGEPFLTKTSKPNSRSVPAYCLSHGLHDLHRLHDSFSLHKRDRTKNFESGFTCNPSSTESAAPPCTKTICIRGFTESVPATNMLQWGNVCTRITAVCLCVRDSAVAAHVFGGWRRFCAMCGLCVEIAPPVSYSEKLLNQRCCARCYDTAKSSGSNHFDGIDRSQLLRNRQRRRRRRCRNPVRVQNILVPIAYLRDTSEHPIPFATLSLCVRHRYCSGMRCPRELHASFAHSLT